MELIVLGSSSRGNCYLLKGEKECLILECGVPFTEVKKALNFDLSSVVGCLITHEHKNHCKYIKELINSGIDIYMSAGTKKALAIENYRIKLVEEFEKYKVGEFTVIPFPVKHDCEEPMAFLISHKEMGNLLFVTDTYYIEYQFINLSHILVECNYSRYILNENIEAGLIHGYLKDRIIRSHFELENVKEFIKANDNENLKNVVLLHLSENNSNALEFKATLEELTGKRVEIADKGLNLELK